MKLRIQDNAVRFRLNRREVSEFENSGTVAAAVQFPGGRRLKYVVEKGGADSIDAAFESDTVVIRIPEQLARNWTNTDQVGLRERRRLTDGHELEIVIEKDFQCMHKGDEAKDPDAYPNPLVHG